MNDRKLNNVRKSSNSQPPSQVAVKASTIWTPQKPNFPNPSITKPSKVSSTKGKSEVHSVNHWFEGQGKTFQTGKFAQGQIQLAYAKYLNEFTDGSFSSQDSNTLIQQWKPINNVTKN